MTQSLDDLDPAGTLARAEDVVRRRRAIEVEDLLVVARWADLHGWDPRKGPGGRRLWCGEDRLVQVGGEGTPLVQELCLAELGIARRVHTNSARAAMADVLDLCHRLPMLWEKVESLDAEAWVARKVAGMTRHLAPAAAAVVDAAVADAIAGEAPSRVLEIAQAKIIEADAAGHAAKVEAERRRRFVGLSRTDEFGLRHLIARITAGDAAWLDAMVDRVADILLPRADLRPDTPAEISKDEARSLALGWLARPAELLRLLLEEAQAAPADDEPSRAVTVPARTLDQLRSTDLTGLRPRTTLFVHLHQAALQGATGGVARVEGLGPMLLSQLKELLGHTAVDLTPVIDLHDQVSVNSYEHPESVRTRLHLRVPGEVFPHASRRSRRVDIDHPVPYDPLGPPGQTGDHNAAPLGRTNHRAKTHLGYQVRQTEHGEYLWRTPHRLHRIVDERGTHLIDQSQYDAMTGDDPLDRALGRLFHRARTGALT